MVFLRNKNSLFHQAAIFFMATMFFLCALWALQGKGIYQPAGQLSEGLNYLFAAGNAVVIIGLGYGSLRWKDWMQGILAMAQGILLGWVLWHAGSFGVPGSFVLDHLSGLMLLLVDGVGALILLFASRAMETHERRISLKKSGQPLFIAMVSLLLGSMNGLILANQLLWMLFFWQSAVLCAFGLIVHGRTTFALKTARYFVKVCSAGSVAFLAGIGLVYAAAGTMAVSELLLFKETTLLMAPLACFVVAGLVLSAQFPFQSALIRSTASSTQVLALLQSSSTVVAGVYIILRLSPLFMNTWLAKIVAVIGAFSFAAALLLAAMQQEVKRILTLTTISSMGLVIALACFPALQAIYAAILLVVLHGVSKSLLFLCCGGHSRTPIPGILTLLGGAAMLTPPFGPPIAQWTAMEVSVRNPAAMGLIIAGCVFSMIVWTRFIAKRLSVHFSDGTEKKMNLLSHAPQLALAFGMVVLSVFLVPFANYFVMPVLKENYGRFDDIAQGTLESLVLQDFSGVNPLPYFVGLGVIFCLGWFGSRFFTRSEEASTSILPMAKPEDGPKPENTSEEIDQLPEILGIEEIYRLEIEAALAAEKKEREESTEIADRSIRSDSDAGMPAMVEIDVTTMSTEVAGQTHDEGPKTVVGVTDDAAVDPKTVNETSIPRCLVFAVFPDARKTHLYATVIAGALILLMLEVVFR